MHSGRILCADRLQVKKALFVSGDANLPSDVVRQQTAMICQLVNPGRAGFSQSGKAGVPRCVAPRGGSAHPAANLRSRAEFVCADYSGQCGRRVSEQ